MPGARSREWPPFPSGGNGAWARARRTLLPPPLAPSFPPRDPDSRQGRGRGSDRGPTPSGCWGPRPGRPQQPLRLPSRPGAVFPPLAQGGRNAPSGMQAAGVSRLSTAAGERPQKGPEPRASRMRFPPHSVAAQTAKDEGFILFSETLFCKCIFSEDVLSISADRAASQKELTALPRGQLPPPFPNSVEPPGLPPTARQPITLPGPGRSPNLPKS